MMKKKMLPLSVLISLMLVSNLAITQTLTQNKYTIEEKKVGDITLVIVNNPNNGAVLGMTKESGIKLIEVEDQDGTIYAFKDMNGNGQLEPWKDWRLSADERAADLANSLTKDEIAGLMLFSDHERNPQDGLTVEQKKYLQGDNLRNVLNAGSNDVKATVLWNNDMQAYVESLVKDGKKVIPVNFSSDPRHIAGSDAQYNAKGDDISRWPSTLGIAATFDPQVMAQFANVMSQEFRALGITTSLAPQIDLATDPRWLRTDGTMGESAQLTVDMTRAYIDAAQSTFVDGNDIGWGKESIVTMAKHFPGEGMGESGRESHMESGKYAVYPGNNFNEHLHSFVDGAFHLKGKTQKAASVMTSYSVAIGADGKPLFGQAVGTSYDKGKLDLLRDQLGYDGVISTDWSVTKVSTDPDNKLKLGMAWGEEGKTVDERHYAILKNGTDMFGGNNDKGPVLAAYDLWQADYDLGKNLISADERFRQSGQRISKLMFETGLFENPYLVLSESEKIVASPDKVKAGYDAQLNSIVMLKNRNNTIKAADDKANYQDKTVYIPSSIRHQFKTVFDEAYTTSDPTMDIDTAKTFFKNVLTDTPITNDKGEVIGFATPDLSNVDLIIIGMNSPDSGGNFNHAGQKEDGSFYPLSLQYRPYTANSDEVRKKSISGNINSDGTKENRSYFGQTSNIGNEYDLTAFEQAYQKASDIKKATGKAIPVIVALKAKNPVIVAEFEGNADAILTGFSVSDKAYYDLIVGNHEPSGLLPLQYPLNMETVEAQLEDVGRDLKPYVDEAGNKYDFAYGLNYQGVIEDMRTQKYK
ncbi:glycoside hydrolase family 3 N-terminal domain-containing protein [Orbus sturtevantii]|uniref:glycoside hydrolase family 3 protein n=1 Tax=Orbus sturtevantii TaxID=3074109 RepID=UPI00370DB84E